MWVGKTKLFAKWAIREGLSDKALMQAIDEISAGLVEANLGGDVYKKRVGIPGRGKQGGARTLLAFKKGDKAFFIYGFTKNERANIKPVELKALKHFANQLLGHDEKAINKMLVAGIIVEVSSDG